MTIKEYCIIYMCVYDPLLHITINIVKLVNVIK